jgi:glyoxylase-like metal-dependent hydrolase (beta-lactamase superfamily II)/rhodanese-related sulfurtransferase
MQKSKTNAMYAEQIYTNCLAEASYYIESDGIACVIDPIREHQPYLEIAARRNAQIKYVFETHFHADFISGHLDLAKETGAQIVFGPGAKTGYEKHEARDGEIFSLGKVSLQVLHTPGHTPESTCFLLKDENGKDYAIFTGDTLFVGDVGRPDLLDGLMSKEELAGMLFDSLQNKIKPLADDVIVYPAHGPGSSCGKNIGKETFSTIGAQKSGNYALQDMSKEEFIGKVTEGLSAPPQYFFMDAKINKNGYRPLEEVMGKNLRPLSVQEFKAAFSTENIFILDTRNETVFAQGHVKNAVNVGLNGSFALWVGAVVPVNAQILLVCESGKERESVLRLARVGYENVIGFLNGGFEVWKNAGENVSDVKTILAEDLENIIQVNPAINILDVRKKGEFAAGHLLHAKQICLSELSQKLHELNPKTPYFVHCAGGYRSVIAVSILQKAGFETLVNIAGGYAKICQCKMPFVAPEESVC